jgi:quercetin dioxygenase-like cupin family protein
MRDVPLPAEGSFLERAASGANRDAVRLNPGGMAMNLIRRQFLYLPGLGLTLPTLLQLAQAQVQQGAPKFNQILRKDLDGQGQAVQETVVIGADFGPGTTSPWHLHPGAQELLFVTEGKLTLEVDGQGARGIDAGDGGFIAADVAHLVRNDNTSTNAKALVVFSRSAKDKPLLVLVKR